MDAFRGGVADARSLMEKDSEIGLLSLCKLLVLAARQNPFDARVECAPDATREHRARVEDTRRARRAAHAAANRRLRRKLAGGEIYGILGDYLSLALTAWHDGSGAIAASVLAALATADPRSYWRGEMLRGVETAVWFANSGAYGEGALDLLVATVSAGGCEGDPTERTVQALVAFGLERTPGAPFRRLAPAFEALWGAEADDAEAKEKLEGFGAAGGDGAREIARHQTLLKIAKGALKDEARKKFQWETSDHRAHLPFRKPPTPRRRRFKPPPQSSWRPGMGTRGSQGTRGSTRDSLGTRGSLSTRGSLGNMSWRTCSSRDGSTRGSSRASTARSDVDRLLGILPDPEDAPAVEKRHAREPLSRRTRALPPKRAPRPVRVNFGLPSEKAMVGRHEARVAARSFRDIEAAAAARGIMAKATASLPDLRDALAVPARDDRDARAAARAHEAIERRDEDALGAAEGFRIARTAEMGALRKAQYLDDPRNAALANHRPNCGASLDTGAMQASMAGYAASVDAARRRGAAKARLEAKVKAGFFFKPKAEKKVNYDF